MPNRTSGLRSGLGDNVAWPSAYTVTNACARTGIFIDRQTLLRDRAIARFPAMRNPPRLSALVVARNEQDYLPDCLISLRFADEIVVVLDRSTDESAKIAEQAGAKIVEGAWELEGERRNVGIDTCDGDWILEVDADERIPSELQEEIRTFIQSASPGVYGVPVRNYIGDREVVYGWGAYIGVNASNRLFTRNEKRWGLERVHPSSEQSGATGRMKNGLIHFVDRDLGETFARLNRYTTLAAKDAVANNTDPTLFTAMRHIVSRSWKCFLQRKGYKEGFYGLALAMCAGSYTLQIYLKCRELRTNGDA